MSGKTLVSASSKEIESKGLNIEISKNVGKKLAEKAVSNGISTVVFDRGGYLFHGKVKALAEGAREGGLKF
jgi:large subunit ribosomal protein L18